MCCKSIFAPPRGKTADFQPLWPIGKMVLSAEKRGRIVTRLICQIPTRRTAEPSRAIGAAAEVHGVRRSFPLLHSSMAINFTLVLNAAQAN